MPSNTKGCCVVVCTSKTEDCTEEIVILMCQSATEKKQKKAKND
jgi:hypothetical protein